LFKWRPYWNVYSNIGAQGWQLDDCAGQCCQTKSSAASSRSRRALPSFPTGQVFDHGTANSPMPSSVFASNMTTPSSLDLPVSGFKVFGQEFAVNREELLPHSATGNAKASG